MTNEQLTANYVWYKDEESYLGEGIFGVVYRGKHRHTGEVVAVKVSRLQQHNYYIEDIETLKSLNSPYVIKYHAVEEVENSFPREDAIVMEIGDTTLGSELEKEANRKGIPKHEFLVLIDNGVKALEYLDVKNLSHRDIKPPNVLVFRRKEEPTLTFKLCDFGTSRLLDSQNPVMSTKVGTPAYSPASVFDSTKSTYKYTKDDRDIWSTACCFFEAATGRLPFIPHVQTGASKGNSRAELVGLLRDRPSDIVCGQFDEESGAYVYHKEMPQQHESYTQSFRRILCSYFQMLFNKDKKYLKLGKFASLSKEVVSAKEYEYFCLTTLTTESYCATTSPSNLPRETFLDAIVKAVQHTSESLDQILISAAARKVSEALNDEATRVQIPQADYTEPLIAVLLPLHLPQKSLQPYYVATLRDTAEGVRFELQDNDGIIKTVTKAKCTVDELVEDQAFPALASYRLSCANRTADVKNDARMMQPAAEDECYNGAETFHKDGEKDDSTDSDGNIGGRNNKFAESEIPLISAARDGNNDAVKLLIDQEADVNATDKDGLTPIMAAVSHGHLDVVKTLVQNGANIMANEHDGYTVLHYACKKGYVKIAAFLLDNKVDVDVRNGGGETPLWAAASGGKNDAVKLLIQRGANVNDFRKDGWTPVIQAARRGHLDVIKTLVLNGASIIGEKKNSYTALHCACYEGHVETVKYLLDYLLDKKVDVDIRDPDHRTPLFHAASNGKNATVVLLISRGADVNAADETGRTPTIQAAANGHLEVVKTLTEKGANIMAKKKYSGYTALHWACKNGHVQIAAYLLRMGADINVKTANGMTSLMIAEKESKFDVVRLLRERGAKA